MSDGRLFTDYRPRCDINYMNLQKEKAMDSYTYRQYLMNNGEQIMNGMRQCVYTSAVCGPCKEPFEVGTMLPEESIDVCDKRSCRRVATGSAQAVGLGRYYGKPNADAKDFQAFKAAEQKRLSSSAGNCCATTNDDLAYFAPHDMPTTVNRNSVPFGGNPLNGGDPSLRHQQTSLFANA
jgi:hypothetical protein